MKRGLLGLAAVILLADLVVVGVRTQAQPKPKRSADALASFTAAIKRHDYEAAYAFTDLGDITVSGGSSAITLPYFAAFERAHPTTKLTQDQGVVKVPTTNVTIVAPTGPLPGLSVDGVRVPLRASRLGAVGAAAAFTYRYAIVMISGPHALSVSAGPVTEARSAAVTYHAAAASTVVTLGLSSSGDRRLVQALDAITMGCPDDECLVAPCNGRGGEYVLDAWGIGTPPIVSRALVGDRVIAPMPPDGWSIAVTFADQGQPPHLSGHEQTKQIRARYVFGFVGSARGMLLDKCWISAG